MQNYIIAFDLTDDAVRGAATQLSRILERPAVVDVNQVDEWPAAEDDCTLYLIDHGDGRGMGSYTDPSMLLRDHGKIATVFRKAKTVVLVSCSTASQADIILRGGFQAATFAKNFKSVDKSKTIKAAVGPVIVGPSDLRVKVPSGLLGFASTDGWVAY